GRTKYCGRPGSRRSASRAPAPRAAARPLACRRSFRTPSRLGPGRSRRRPGGLTLGAVIGVGAHEHVPAPVVGDDLVEVAFARAAESADLVPALHLERMVLEVEALDPGVGRDRVDALLAPRPEQL